MALIVTFLLGIGNFAWHRAVLESGHPMVSDLTPSGLHAIRFASLALEFILLCAALFAVRGGEPTWVFAYLLYSLMNGGAAWALVKGRHR